MFLDEWCYHHIPRHWRKTVGTRESISAPEQTHTIFSILENIKLCCSVPQHLRKSSLVLTVLETYRGLRQPEKLPASSSLNPMVASVGYMGQGYPHCPYIWPCPSYRPRSSQGGGPRGPGGRSMWRPRQAENIQDRLIWTIARINLLRIPCNKLGIQSVSSIALIVTLPPLSI
jgi:hypothetical protein